MSKYRCWRCKRVVMRDSNKLIYKSYCTTTGKDTRLVRVFW